jgi:hypothetical protein
VIATPHGFAWDLIEDWREGFIVDFDDVPLLQERLLHFVRQPLLVRSLGEASRQTVASALNEWRFLDTHVELYRGLAESQATLPSAPSAIGRGPSFLTTKRAWDYYPLRAEPPSSARLRALVPGAPHEFDKHESADYEAWTAGAWTVRWLHHLILDRPIWDPRATMLVRQAPERLDAIQAASLTGCFVPIHRMDYDAQLVLIDSGLTTDPTQTEAGLDEALALLERLERSAADLATPAWMQLPKQIERLYEQLDDAAPILGVGERQLFARLRGATDGPEVPSWDPSLPGPSLRWRTVEGRLLLDGGCRLCIGTAGRPLALLVLESLDEPSRLEALLDRIAPLPDRVIAWAWLTILETAMMAAAMRRPLILHETRRRALLLSAALEGSFFTLSS